MARALQVGPAQPHARSVLRPTPEKGVPKDLPRVRGGVRRPQRPIDIARYLCGCGACFFHRRGFRLPSLARAGVECPFPCFPWCLAGEPCSSPSQGPAPPPLPPYRTHPSPAPASTTTSPHPRLPLLVSTPPPMYPRPRGIGYLGSHCDFSLPEALSLERFGWQATAGTWVHATLTAASHIRRVPQTHPPFALPLPPLCELPGAMWTWSKSCLPSLALAPAMPVMRPGRARPSRIPGTSHLSTREVYCPLPIIRWAGNRPPRQWGGLEAQMCSLLRTASISDVA